MSGLTKNSDPVYVGPGVWYSMSATAANAQNTNLMIFCIWYIKNIASGFKCLNCRKHFLKNIENDPLEKCMYEKDKYGRYIGLFKWVHRAHDRVNKFLGKASATPDLMEAFEYFYNADLHVCIGDCGNNEEIKNKLTEKLFEESLPAPEYLPRKSSTVTDHYSSEILREGSRGILEGEKSQRPRFRLIGRF